MSVLTTNNSWLNIQTIYRFYFSWYVKANMEKKANT